MGYHQRMMWFDYSLSAISSAFATDFGFFIAARMLGGVAVGLALLRC